MDHELECWEKWWCFLAVPSGIIAGFAALGCICGLSCVFYCQDDEDAEAKAWETVNENNALK